MEIEPARQAGDGKRETDQEMIRQKQETKKYIVGW
jgi:hypothetical protein